MPQPGGHPPYATERSFRRSRSLRPAHTPEFIGSASAYSRHSCRTEHVAQMARAVVVVAPSPGKNRAGSAPRHAARAIHAGRWAKSSIDGNAWSRLVVDIIQAHTSGVSSSGTQETLWRAVTLAADTVAHGERYYQSISFAVLRCLYGPDEPGMGLVPDSFR